MTTSRIIMVQGFGACTEALNAFCDGRKVFCILDPAVVHHIELPESFSTFMAPKGECSKDLSTAQQIWEFLLSGGFHRSDFVVTIGGGAMSDLGGFVASTFKRGMRLMHIPTTVLGAVDAAIGGKTAIDFGGVKNSIGTFYPPEAIILAEEFFQSLPSSELLSGWGEVLKYSMLSSTCALSNEDTSRLEQIMPPTSECIRHCIDFKVDVTSEDPEDKGSRQILNFGHTVGHALEALMMETSTPTPHGCAVAAGMVVELYLSLMKVNFPQHKLMTFARMVKASFPPIHFGCKQYDRIVELTLQDKKNTDQAIRSILLQDIGQPLLPIEITPSELEEALDFYRDFMGV